MDARDASRGGGAAGGGAAVALARGLPQAWLEWTTQARSASLSATEYAAFMGHAEALGVLYARQAWPRERSREAVESRMLGWWPVDADFGLKEPAARCHIACLEALVANDLDLHVHRSRLGGSVLGIALAGTDVLQELFEGVLSLQVRRRHARLQRTMSPGGERPVSEDAPSL